MSPRLARLRASPDVNGCSTIQLTSLGFFVLQLFVIITVLFHFQSGRAAQMSLTFNHGAVSPGIVPRVCVASLLSSRLSDIALQGLTYEQTLNLAFATVFNSRVLERFSLRGGGRGLSECIDKASANDYILIFSHGGIMEKGTLFLPVGAGFAPIDPEALHRRLAQTKAKGIFIVSCSGREVEVTYGASAFNDSRLRWIQVSDVNNEALYRFRDFLGLPADLSEQGEILRSFSQD